MSTDLGSSRSRSGKSRASSIRIGETDIFVIGRDARHGDGAFRKLAMPSPLTSLLNHCLACHQYAQPDVIAFSVGFLNAAVAHLDALETPRTATASQRPRRRVWPPRRDAVQRAQS